MIVAIIVAIVISNNAIYSSNGNSSTNSIVSDTSSKNPHALHEGCKLQLLQVHVAFSPEGDRLVTASHSAALRPDKNGLQPPHYTPELDCCSGT